MSTRATIKFVDEFGDEAFIYRHCDGYPEQVIPDLERVIELSRGRWSGSELGQLVSLFFVANGNIDERIQDYSWAQGWQGDESFRYVVVFGAKWEVIGE